MKNKEYCFYLDTINSEKFKKKSYALINEFNQDPSLKTVKNDCFLNKKDKIRAKSLRNSPLPMKTVLKFRSPSKTPEAPLEKFSNPYNIRFLKLEEIRKKITSKIFNPKSDFPKNEFQVKSKQPHLIKIAPEKQVKNFFITNSNLNSSSKLLSNQKNSNNVLEKFSLNSPFVAYYYTKNSPKLCLNPKLNQNKLLN